MPNLFVTTEVSKGNSSTSKGEWIFNSADNTIILMSPNRRFRGLNKITNIGSSELKMESSKEKFSFTKVEISNLKVERLTFSEDGFYDEDGNFDYEVAK